MEFMYLGRPIVTISYSFCSDGRILAKWDASTIQIPKHSIRRQVKLTFNDWLQYQSQLSNNTSN